MVFPIRGGMQQPGEKIRNSKRNRRKQSVKFPHIASFRILSRNSLEIPVGVDGVAIEEDKGNNEPTFAGGSMPEQAEGYIKCKKHDFL
jgi:hypothetical protein